MPRATCVGALALEKLKDGRTFPITIVSCRIYPRAANRPGQNAVNVDIAEASQDQLEEIYAIECACFSPPWSKAALGGLNGSADGGILSAVDNGGAVIGFLCYLDMYDALHIANIAVFEQFRNRGVADALMRAFLRINAGRTFPDVTLEVRTGNRAAISAL
jgi:ribosomal-protein-alanine N-acetyltransferase